MNDRDCYISSDKGKNGTGVHRGPSGRARRALIAGGKDSYRLGEAASRDSDHTSSHHGEACTTGVRSTPDQSKRLPIREPCPGHYADGAASESAPRKARRYGVPLLARVEAPAWERLGRR